MSNKIKLILDQISALEDELKIAVEEHQESLRYQIEGKRITFERAVREVHLKVRQGVFNWFLTVRPQNYLTAPVIYGMIVPMVIFDLSISIYQILCFPIYGIARVRRTSYILFDHQHLAYLNIIEKFDCMYCSYAVGLLAYAQEITARTEQYFCPIKHARKILSAHARYANFLNYGEADDFHIKLEEYRTALAKEALQAKES
ncbi:MAG: hypothetical protein PHI29_03490 [Gallionella sp.]|nr:hypothetical protein [Gallionella sp.]